MSLDASKIKSTTLIANFRNMHNLICLKVYKSDKIKPSKLIICEDLDYLPEGLRFFSWEEYPLSYVPSHFPAENLIVLEMPNSNIKQLCDGNQHFPNLAEIVLSNSKHLIALPELSHAPKIEFMDIDGCVNLAQIDSSTMPGSGFQLFIDGSGPVQINIGGSVERTRSGLVIVYNYLDLEKLSFNKVTTKLFVSGEIFFSVQVKHVGMPLAEKAELRAGIESLKSLLPFVRSVEWLESPIELGVDFNQHYTYSYDDWARRNEWDEEEEESYDELIEDEEEVDDELTVYRCREDKEEDDHELIMDYCCCNSATSMQDEEEDQDDELIMEYCCSIFTRVPNSITRWSLLKQLRLKESDIIGNNAAGSTIAQLSILKSLIPLSHDNYWTRVQPRLDLKFSSDTQTSASRHYYIDIHYNLDMNKRRPGNIEFFCLFCEDDGIWIRTADSQSSRPVFTISFLWKLG